MEQDNGTRIVAVCKLLKSALRTKRVTIVHCQKFNTLKFLTEDEGKNVGEFEAILLDVSRLTSVCQNEEKLNGACGTVVRKSLHDSLWRATMRIINTDHLSSDKEIIHPTRSEINVNSFTKAGKNMQNENITRMRNKIFQ